eukprot:GHRR01001893.1.p2 GENE.GHRR01001893.1~~GHRR01001893.1.p2  ORF type:complete len:228 (+),score=65.93 GHRR01001893.1:44-685(+)
MAMAYCTKAPLSGAFTSVRPRAQTTTCAAVRNANVAGEAVNRRAAMAGFYVATAGVFVPKAWALIPNEEDEELLERAKANRQKRLALQKETTRDFIREEGLKDKQLNSELIPVQKAVNQLAKSGAQLEAGDLKAVSSTLNSSWVDDFQRATAVLDASDSQKDQAAAIFDGISGLKASVGSGDLRASKQKFVSLVAAVEGWAKTTGLAADLKGL